MAKIIKSEVNDGPAVSRFEREVLEHWTSPPADGAAGDGGEVQLPDPEQVLAEIRAEAERKAQDAYAKGYRRGEQAGREAFEASVAKSAEAIRAAGEALVKAQEVFLAERAPQVVQLAHAIASRILGREAQTDRELILTSARRGLHTLTDRRRVQIRLNPKDYEAVRQHQVTLLDEIEGLDHIELTPDETISPGGALVESETSYADVTLEAQLARILENLPL